MVTPAHLASLLHDAVGEVLIGMEDSVDGLTIGLLTRGHVLLEGVPGVAKTTLANSFANALGLSYGRIQLTPDVLPADITGTTVYREDTGAFDFQQGPIFANVVLADEINRAPPKTQSAMLEAMAEGHVTGEGETLSLPEPFMVIATQNPIEMEGTYELAEAQRDRFQQKLTIDLPSRETEKAMIDRFSRSPTLTAADVDKAISSEAVAGAREHVETIHLSESLEQYILDLVAATRNRPDVAHGASPRATLALTQTARAGAAIDGREYVRPDDVKAMLKPVLIHRLVMSTEAELGGVDPVDVIDDIASSVPAPGSPSSKAEPPTDERDGAMGDIGRESQ
jgi:MoxR-like ATPase